jgi:hypothetical protein
VRSALASVALAAHGSVSSGSALSLATAKDMQDLATAALTKGISEPRQQVHFTGTFFAYPRSKRRRGWYGSSETVADIAV